MPGVESTADAMLSCRGWSAIIVEFVGVGEEGVGGRREKRSKKRGLRKADSEVSTSRNFHSQKWTQQYRLGIGFQQSGLNKAASDSYSR